MQKVAVITGGTRGIGFGLATEFLKRGHSVAICGRNPQTTQDATEQLAQVYGTDKIIGVPCDVTDYDATQNLWDETVSKFGKVDMWINNAGLSHPPQSLWELDASQFNRVVSVNVVGLMNGCKVAMNGMSQQGHGFIYNMEGSGSSGSPMPNLVLYQTTKRALSFYTAGLLKESKKKNIPVNVCTISPGIVITDLLFEGYTQEEIDRTKRIFNILADRVEPVTEFLVEGMLKNEKNGARIAWLTTPKIAWRFATARFTNRNVFDD